MTVCVLLCVCCGDLKFLCLSLTSVLFFFGLCFALCFEVVADGRMIWFSGFPFLDNKEEHSFGVPVSAVMIRDLILLPSVGLKLDEVEAIVAETTFGGFPIVQDRDSKVLLGYIGRTELKYAIGTDTPHPPPPLFFPLPFIPCIPGYVHVVSLCLFCGLFEDADVRSGETFTKSKSHRNVLLLHPRSRHPPSNSPYPHLLPPRPNPHRHPHNPRPTPPRLPLRTRLFPRFWPIHRLHPPNDPPLPTPRDRNGDV